MTNSTSTRSVLCAVGIAVPLIALWVHGWIHLPFLYDDGLISLRYAKRFASGAGLTWNDGYYVEGYSNFLWVVGLAGLSRLGITVIEAARALGMAGMSAAIAIVAFTYRPRETGSVLPALVGGLLLALSGPIAVWSIGGLEQPLVAAWLAWALAVMFPIVDQSDFSPRRGFWVGLPLALLCLTRPDSGLYVFAFCLAAMLIGGLRWRSIVVCLAICALPILTVAGHTAFRLYYYNDWLPNTVYVKATFTPDRLYAGALYMGKGVVFAVPTLLLAGTGIWAGWWGKHQRGRVLLLCVVAGLWSAYVTWVGGDTCPCWRHWVPLLVTFAYLAAIGAQWIVAGWPGSAHATGIGYAVALALLLGSQVAAPSYRWSFHERWEWHGEVVGLMLKEAFGDRKPLLAVDAAGAVPFFSELETLDMMGLNDRHIAKQPPVPGEHLGHDHVDPQYVLNRQPDLVIFYLPFGGPPTEPGGTRMAEDPRFFRDYQMVRFRGTHPYEVDSRIWVRRCGTIGIQAGRSNVDVPGFLIEAEKQEDERDEDRDKRIVVARFNDDRRFGAEIQSVGNYAVRDLRLAAGDWRLELVPSADSMHAELRDASGTAIPVDDAGRFQISVGSAAGPLRLVLALESPVFVEKIRLSTSETLPIETTTVSAASNPSRKSPIHAP